MDLEILAQGSLSGSIAFCCCPAPSYHHSRTCRHFHYFKVPPIRWWNPDITIHEKKIERGEPSLIIEKGNQRSCARFCYFYLLTALCPFCSSVVDGSKIEIDLKNMRADQIMERVLASSGSLPAQ